MVRMKRTKISLKPKEEIAEDYCFICKDGGDLLICDYKQCLKSYHFDCVDKDESFSTSKEKWICDWHSCLVCHRTSQVHCYCCPKATCWHCIDVAELVIVKGKYGFCSNCLKLAVLVEDNTDVDSDGEKVDFKDRETYEGLFMEYYKIIQKKEGFSADNVRAAKYRLKTGKNILSGSEADDTEDKEEDEVSSDEDMENMKDYKPHKNKRFKKGLSGMQRSVKSKRMQFCGWGSTSLIQFLKSIGRDTSQKLSQHDVHSIIRRYIIENNLYDPEKKKKIICDEKLQSIFHKKTMNKNKIYGLLEAHLIENLEESEEEEEAMHDSEYEDKNPLVTCKTRQMSKTEEGSPKRDAKCSVPHSCYASVTAENIKHVYLRKSLVYELSKQPESFERKIIGSFVRVKSDPHDYNQRSSHQLVQVTGIMKFATGEESTEIILCVSKIPKEISISLLSDADFSEEECEDLRQKVQDGLVQKPTIVELQEKARNLHVDITKHWIARELKILDQRRDQANEKGWRREFFEYIERKKLLQTPLEQSRLLENYPTVIPDVADLDPKNQDTVHEEKLDEALPRSILSMDPNLKSGVSPDVADVEPTDKDTVDEQRSDEDLPESIFSIDPNDKLEGSGTSNSFLGAEDKEYRAHVFLQEEKQNLDRKAIPVSPHNSTSMDKMNEQELGTLEEHPLQILLAPGDQHKVTSQIDGDWSCSSASVKRRQQNDDAKQAMSNKQEALANEVIELDSDDESQPNAAVEQQIVEDPESSVWLISGPDGVKRKSKYSLSLLKRWSEASSYALKFKVWKENQSEEQAIPLRDAINLAFTRP